MKIVARPIEIICWFNRQGISPIKFKIPEDDGSNKVIKIDKIISKELEKLCGNLMWVFECQSNIDGFEKQYQLKYDIGNCKWILFKI